MSLDGKVSLLVALFREALRDLIACQVPRVLTSGGHETAITVSCTSQETGILVITLQHAGALDLRCLEAQKVFIKLVGVT